MVLGYGSRPWPTRRPELWSREMASVVLWNRFRAEAKPETLVETTDRTCGDMFRVTGRHIVQRGSQSDAILPVRTGTAQSDELFNLLKREYLPEETRS